MKPNWRNSLKYVFVQVQLFDLVAFYLIANIIFILLQENRNLNASTREVECNLSEISSRNASLKGKSAELIKVDFVLCN